MFFSYCSSAIWNYALFILIYWDVVKGACDFLFTRTFYIQPFPSKGNVWVLFQVSCPFILQTYYIIHIYYTTYCMGLLYYTYIIDVLFYLISSILERWSWNRHDFALLYNREVHLSVKLKSVVLNRFFAIIYQNIVKFSLTKHVLETGWN